ncbi:MAG TPA: Type 1 glutamine amidotransferase-like domain-containing protein [Anaerolineales bacterium]|nr:Type 1 glutamine amidotransferase-like domain-containing protein [Anaerolineales bacterium]HNQ95142.1 Type 1 glutamine amidotransferase-like domain-containing protein [Anaerolineales bacterium]HNS62428.1 Type 1 glutamine amidotransferase-like domain-containing protein [Anaerolineales bacterium]
MNGLIAIVGAGEYLPVMEEVDRYLLSSVNSKTPRVVCLPTAAGQEGDDSVNRWSRMGVEHFQKLGADVQALRIIDKESANDSQFDSSLENADFIYFSGGNPMYLFQTMQGSRAWASMQKAWSRGAVYAGCSAGAMILSKRVPSFRLAQNVEGFGVIPAQFILPHFDAMPLVFKPMIFALRKQLKKGEQMLGVDENTALVGRVGGEWKVMGQGTVHLITRDEDKTFNVGETVPLE